jgi:hypothetical protein
MTTALCPDGVSREVTSDDGLFVTVQTPGGQTVRGTVVDGKFKLDPTRYSHQGAHKMWEPPLVYDPKDHPSVIDRAVSAESIDRIERHVAAGSPGIEGGDFKS